jgi:signal transduction histidine kinase
MQFKAHNEVQRSEPNDSLWYLLGLRSSLSFRLILLSIFPCALSPIFIDRANYGGSNLLWSGLILLAHTGFSICILAAGKLIHKSSDGKSHPLATLLAFLFAQAVRGSILGFSTVFLEFTDDPKLAFRILSGGIFISTVLSVIAISIAVFDQHSNLVRNLENKTSELLHLRISMDTRLQEATKNLRQYAQQVVSPRINQIDQLLDSLKSGGNKDNAVHEMQHYVETELRPFSHRIAHDKSLQTIDLQEKNSDKKFQLPSTVNLSQSMRPYVTTVLFFITYAAAAQRTMTFIEALPFNIVTTVLLISYFVFFKKLFANRDVPIAIGLVLGASIFACVGPLILFLESYIPIEIPQHISGATVFVGLIYGFANLGYTILTSQRTQLISELTTTIQNLESTISLLSQKEWIARRQVGYVMHGSLQSALNAAVLQLGATKDPTPELIESVRGEIARALARVGFDAGQSYSFEQAKDEIANIWSGTIQINWALDPDLSSQLQKNPETSECLAEVVREAVSNAAKHGSATKIEIDVDIEDSAIHLQVIDNGKSSNSGTSQGLGTELMKDVCSSWSLNSNPAGGKVFRANLLLGA